jgi:hypothetical protein
MTIATQIAAGLATGIESAVVGILSDPVYVVAEGNAPAGGDDYTQDIYALPRVAVRTAECNPDGYKSTLREYPVEIEVATAFGRDARQVQLYALAAAVCEYMAAAPIVTLSGALHNALTFSGPASRSNDEDIQRMTWQAVAHVRKTTKEA